MAASYFQNCCNSKQGTPRFVLVFLHLLFYCCFFVNVLILISVFYFTQEKRMRLEKFLPRKAKRNCVRCGRKPSISKFYLSAWKKKMHE